MKLIRVKKDTNFTTINNAFIFNKNMSLKAKGLLCHILALPNDWTLYVEEVGKWHKDGKGSIYSAFKELTANGYMKREKVRDEAGKIVKWDYLIFEKPHTDFQDVDNPDVDNQDVDNPDVDNQQLLNTNITKDLIKLNTNNSKTEGIEYPFELNLESWNLWKEFKKEQFKTNFKPIGEKAAIVKLLKISGGCLETQSSIINQSIENGWKGLFKLKEEKGSKAQAILSEYEKGLNLINNQFDD